MKKLFKNFPHEFLISNGVNKIFLIFIFAIIGLFFWSGTALALSAPNLTEPQDGEAITRGTVMFKWDPVPEADKGYHYYISDPNGNRFAEQNNYPATVVEFDIFSLGTYNWKVQACKTNWLFIFSEFTECGDWSQRSFTIVTEIPIPKPNLTSPQNEETVTTLTPTLEWEWPGEPQKLNYYTVEITGDLATGENQTSIVIPAPKSYYIVSSRLLKNGKSYTWRVKAVDNKYNDGPWSDSRIFKTSGIEPVSSLTVTSPNGGQEWKVGTTQNITWTSTGPISTATQPLLSIDLYKDDSQYRHIGNVPMPEGNYSWTIPSDIADGSNYKIRLFFSVYVLDYSNLPFTIYSSTSPPPAQECPYECCINESGYKDKTCSTNQTCENHICKTVPSTTFVKVIYPNGAEKLIVGTPIKISWQTSDNIKEVRILYQNETTGQSQEIVSSISANASPYNWTIPADLKPGNYKIQVISLTALASGYGDNSDNYFSVRGIGGLATCPAGQDRPHKECVNISCQSIDSCGQDTCQTNAACATAAPGAGAPPPSGVTGPAPGGALYTEEKCEIQYPDNKIKNPKVYKAGDKYVAYDGLVPCGKCVLIGVNVDDKGKIVGLDSQGYTTASTGGELKNLPCQFCHFFVMFKGIIDWVTGVLVPIVAVLMLVIGGLMFFFGGVDPKMLQTGRNIIKSVVWGLIIIFAAYMIVNIVLSFLGLAEFGAQGFDPRNWFKFPCPITLP